LNEWDIYKRYSDFASLNDMLLPIVRAKGVQVPKLPPAIPNVKEQRQKLLNNRKLELEKYL